VARERPSTYLQTNTNTQPRGFGWRINCGVEVTELSTNKQHSLSVVSVAEAVTRGRRVVSAPREQKVRRTYCPRSSPARALSLYETVRA
jgi:hypothetical protein